MGLGKGGGLKAGFSRNFETRGDGRGSFEGLSGRALGLGVSGHNESSAMRVVIEKVLDISRRIGRGPMRGPAALMDEKLRVSLLGKTMIAFLIGCIGARAAKFSGAMGVSTIRLLLGSSWVSPRVSIDVAGLGLAERVPLSLASDDFGRARFEVGRTAGGRMALPTLIENEEAVEFEVFLDWEELLLYDWENEDGLREWTAAMTAELTGALYLGAAGVALIGSPARSARVFLFEAGSGTVSIFSIFPCLSRDQDEQFDPCRLWFVKPGGGIAMRELLAEALSSVSCF